MYLKHAHDVTRAARPSLRLPVPAPPGPRPAPSAHVVRMAFHTHVTRVVANLNAPNDLEHRRDVGDLGRERRRHGRLCCRERHAHLRRPNVRGRAPQPFSVSGSRPGAARAVGSISKDLRRRRAVRHSRWRRRRTCPPCSRVLADPASRLRPHEPRPGLSSYRVAYGRKPGSATAAGDTRQPIMPVRPSRLAPNPPSISIAGCAANGAREASCSLTRRKMSSGSRCRNAVNSAPDMTSSARQARSCTSSFAVAVPSAASPTPTMAIGADAVRTGAACNASCRCCQYSGTVVYDTSSSPVTTQKEHRPVAGHPAAHQWGCSQAARRPLATPWNRRETARTTKSVVFSCTCTAGLSTRAHMI